SATAKWGEKVGEGAPPFGRSTVATKTDDAPAVPLRDADTAPTASDERARAARHADAVHAVRAFAFAGGGAGGTVGECRHARHRRVAVVPHHAVRVVPADATGHRPLPAGAGPRDRVFDDAGKAIVERAGSAEAAARRSLRAVDRRGRGDRRVGIDAPAEVIDGVAVPTLVRLR